MGSLRLVLFGPPGAGKGTQAQLLKKQLNVPHISSGDLFRHHLQQGTPLGQRAKEYMDQGLLVPDEVTIDIMLDKVLNLPEEEGFLLDGFPRTWEQATALNQALEDQSRPLDKVLFIDVPESELLRRLGGRFVCRDCQAPHSITDMTADETLRCQQCGGELYQRADDSPEAVLKRIEVYQTETQPVLNLYRDQGLLANVPGSGSVACINQNLLAALSVTD